MCYIEYHFTTTDFFPVKAIQANKRRKIRAKVKAFVKMTQKKKSVVLIDESTVAYSNINCIVYRNENLYSL